MPVAQVIGENWPQVFNGTISVADVDANGGTEQLTLSVGHGTLTLGSTSGLVGETGNGTSSVVFSGTIANLNGGLNGLIYTPTNGFTGSDNLQVSINDEGNTGTGGAPDCQYQHEPHGQCAGSRYNLAAPRCPIHSKIPRPSSTAVFRSSVRAVLSRGQRSRLRATSLCERRAELCQHGHYYGSYQQVDRRVDPLLGPIDGELPSGLRSVTYQDTSLDPSTATRTFSFSINDPYATSIAGTDNLSVTAVNVAPR